MRVKVSKLLTLHEAASEMHPKWQGGADTACPYKNQFRGHFDPNFSHNFDWGTKINSGLTPFGWVKEFGAYKP